MRLLLMTPTKWLRVYDGMLHGRDQPLERSFIRKLMTRGDILDYFSKVESLVKEIIQARLLGLFLFSEKAEEFDDILQKVGFRGCVELLEGWGVIEGNLKRKIEKINTVRNQYAHSWSEHDVYYEKDPSKKPIRLASNIVKFREDAESVWVGLIEIYMRYEVKDLGRLISKLDDPNTINVWGDITAAREARNISLDEE